MRRSVAVGLASVGGLLAVLTLYVIDWWPGDYENPSFLSTAHALTTAYADPDERQFTMTAATNAFFQWGYLLFTAAVVLAAVGVFCGFRRSALAMAVLTVAASGWMIYAVKNAGLINMRFTAYLPYAGAAMVVAAAIGSARRTPVG